MRLNRENNIKGQYGDKDFKWGKLLDLFRNNLEIMKLKEGQAFISKFLKARGARTSRNNIFCINIEKNIWTT